MKKMEQQLLDLNKTITDIKKKDALYQKTK